MSNQQKFRVGDQPGTGNYRCRLCGDFVAMLLQPKDQLPPCENCGSNPAVAYEVDNREAAASHGP